ncbi:MAG: hypothetical protein DWQ10_08650, partial [Calditrichaeota bacterium]
YDNDGFLDIYVVSCYERNILFHNNGDGTFTNIARQAGVDGVGRSVDCVSGAFNNDGWGDFYVGNYDSDPGNPDYGGNYEGYNRLYWNNGDGTFTNAPGITADRARTIGSSIGDINNDGFDDLYTVNSTKLNKLYLNQGNANNWLQIQLEGDQSSRDAIGTRIELDVGGEKRIKEISGASGYCSHSSLIQTFGLGAATLVDRITIKWLSGTIDELTNVNVNQRLFLKEGEVGHTVSFQFTEIGSAMLTPNKVKISWQTNNLSSGYVQYGLTNTVSNSTNPTASGYLFSEEIDGLLADTTYYYKIVAEDTAGQIIKSELASFVTTIAPIPAENIASQATATASSENTRWGQTASKAVDGIVDGYPGDYTKEWVADQSPAGTWINLMFSEDRVIDKIILHDRINLNDQILGMQITFDNDMQLETGPLPNDGSGLEVVFDPVAVKAIRFRVTNAEGSTAGLAEIEVWQAAQNLTNSELSLDQINVTEVDSNSAVIGWKTSISAYGRCFVNEDTLETSLADSHTVFIENLMPETEYPFSVFAESADGQTAQSDIFTFTTMPGIVPSDTTSPDTTETPVLVDITGEGVVSASSEKSRWGQTAFKAVDGIIDGYPGDYTKEWVADETPVGAWIRLSFPQPVIAGKIICYDRPNLNDQILGFVLHFSDGASLEFGELQNDGTASEFTFEHRQTTWIELEVTAARGGNVGLAEWVVWGASIAAKSFATDVTRNPTSFYVSSNYPNPFNAKTRFEVNIPEPGWLQIAIFNIKGEKIKLLADEIVAPGMQKYTWNGRTDNAADVTSGIYFLNTLFIGKSGVSNQSTGKLMYLK